MTLYKTIGFNQSDGVARIELARPDEGHAMSVLLLEELHAAAFHCDERSDVRAVLLTASGRAFFRRWRSKAPRGGRPGCRCADKANDQVTFTG